MIGCGQFAFASIGYFVNRSFGNRFRTCFDASPDVARSFANYFGVEVVSTSAQDAISDRSVRYVYIASNHASHTPYAVEALRLNKVVYIEKPVAVSLNQLSELTQAIRSSEGMIHAGYNRPHSGAIRRLRSWCPDVDSPLTISCFISGHVLGPDHWYRKPEEGTRICGNVGHWLDLAVHLLLWGKLPDRWEIVLSWSNHESRDDDLSITLTSNRGDLVNIVLTARCEPFEGINETINIQWGKTIAKIDDFQRMTVWREHRIKRYRFWPKDVGHERAILQPFNGYSRSWHEIELSTLLMLYVKEMVLKGERYGAFSFDAEMHRLESNIEINKQVKTGDLTKL